MPIVLCVVLLVYAPIEFLKSEVTLGSGKTWARSFILAPGDSLKVEASCIRQVGSSCGCLGGLGDIFLRKGDNVGRAAISEWHGDVVTSAYEQYRPKVVYYSDKGGAFTLSIENHSGHRTNLYSVTAARTPTEKKYASFDASFKADTAHETTWVDEPVYKTVKDTSYELHKWTDTLYDEKPADLKNGSTTLYRGILGSNRSEVTFYLPDNSTGKVGFALFTDLDRLRRLQAEAQEKSKGLAQVAGAIPNPYAVAAGVVLGILGPVTNSGDGAFNFYLVDEENRGYYNAKQSFRSFEKGESVSDLLFTRILATGRMYYVELVNTSFLDKTLVAYQIATTVREPRFENHSETVPVVRVRKVQTGTRRVPRVESNITPHLPWR